MQTLPTQPARLTRSPALAALAARVRTQPLPVKTPFTRELANARRGS